MKYKIWDKSESINGVEASEILDSTPFFKTDEVFLILDDYDIVTNIESCKIIKSIYKLDKNMTVEEVAEYYIKTLKNEKSIS